MREEGFSLESLGTFNHSDCELTGPSTGQTLVDRQMSPPSTSQPQRPGARPSPSSDFDYETLIYSVLNTEIHQDRLWEDHYC